MTVFIQQRNRIRRRGFTIMELVVTVAAMTIMMAAFGNILLQCKRVVNATHLNLRMNHRISVVADLFRRDIQRMTKDGFLCLTEMADGLPAIMFTTGGPSYSVLGDVEGYGSIVAWGLAGRREKDSMNTHLDVLWRPEYVFYSKGEIAFDPTGGRQPPDVANFMYPGDENNLETLQMIKAATHEELAGPLGVIDNIVSENTATYMIPPPSKREADKLWKAVSRDIKRITIMWTDYSEWNDDDSIKWYGMEWDYSANLESWSYAIKKQLETPTAGHPEFYSQDGYRAIWTSHEPGRWPKAVRLQFYFADEALPSGFGKVYEVICDIP